LMAVSSWRKPLLRYSMTFASPCMIVSLRAVQAAKAKFFSENRYTLFRIMR
jgi:hypothetical protein